MSVDHVIRTARAQDAAAIAALHAQSWRASYAGILPDRFLATEVDVERSVYWQSAMRGQAYHLILLSFRGVEPCGFIALQTGSEEGYDATIENLHVSPSMKGKGIGRELMAAATGQLITQGAKTVCLRVFEDNLPAIGFYEKLGGVTDAHGIDELAGSNAPDRRIGWHDLPTLQRACRQ